MSDFITRTISRVRKYTNEPSLTAKYSDTDVLDLIETEWMSILEELNRMTTTPIIVRHTVTLGPSQSRYILPPTVAKILRLASVDATTGQIAWEVIPKSRYNPAGPGIVFEGNTIMLEPKLTQSVTSYTFQMDYVPSADVRLHTGVAGTIVNNTTADPSTCTIVLAANPTIGALDNRPNAYAGQVLRILTASTNNYIQERIIQSYDVTTRIVTLSPAFDATLLPGGATVTYEIAPLMFQAMDNIVAIAVARQIVGLEGDAARFATMTRLYAEKLRTMRLNWGNMEQIMGTRFVHDTVHNVRNLVW